MSHTDKIRARYLDSILQSVVRNDNGSHSRCPTLDVKRSGVVKKKRCGKKPRTLTGVRRGGRRGRKGFIVAVGWTGQEQERYEVVGQLPDY